MSSNLLRLEDCLEDSPQSRALIGVYEKDSDNLLQYAQDLHAAYTRVASAQKELTDATQDLSQKLQEFQTTKFVFGTKDDVIGSTLQQLVTNVEEISSYHAVLHTQLLEGMNFHSSQFLNKDLNEYLRLKSSFQTSDKLHEDSAAKLARISKRKHNEKTWQEGTDQLYASRKSFHNTSMLYCSCLNDLQNKKKLGLLRPAISYLQAQITFFRMGSEVSKVELEEVLGKLSANLTQLESQTAEDRELCVEKMDRLDAQSTRAYIPDPPSSMNFPDLPVDRAKTQISGYLFYRSRGGLLSHWHRSYFFTQGGNLMMQSKNDLAGQLFLDLDGCSVHATEADDRRHVLQVTAADGRHSVILQAESKHQQEEWIATVRNIAAGLYLHDNPRQAAMQALQSHSQTAESAAPSSSLASTSARQPAPVTEARPSADKSPVTHQTSSFETKHESFRPSVFERLKQAASSLMTPEERPQKEERAESIPSSYEPLGGSTGGASGDASLELMLDSSEPILFDLPSPIPEVKPPSVEQLNIESTDEDRGASESGQARQNPFTSDGPAVVELTDSDASFKAMFIVRFLGCRRVAADALSDSSISETICQVMAARAYHKMFRMNELHLAVSDSAIRLVDPTTQLNRETFPASSVLRAKTLADNPRLLGFIARPSNSSEALCYTFESNADGDDVCCAINTARIMEQSKIEHEESAKQKELENDLETQSRMLSSVAASGHEGASEDAHESETEKSGQSVPTSDD